MSATPSLIRRPAAEGARQVALDLLDEAVAAAKRLDDPEDSEALHDFRVALRRLRSVLRAYRPILADSVGRKWERRIRGLFRSTNKARDAEVHFTWLGTQMDQFGPQARDSLEKISPHMQHEIQTAYAKVRAKTMPDFYKLEPQLRNRFSVYWSKIQVEGGDPVPQATFGETTGRLVRRYIDEMWALLSRIESHRDQDPIHDARIAGKRLRYLLEPLRDEHSGVKKLVKWLKRLQDFLGDMNDMHVMRTELDGRMANIAELIPAEPSTDVVHAQARGLAVPSANPMDVLNEGIKHLKEEAAARCESLYLAYEQFWLEGAGNFLSDAYKLTRDLGQGSRAPAQRTFLLSSLPRQARKLPTQTVRCGWTFLGEVSEFLRETTDASGGVHSLERVTRWKDEKESRVLALTGEMFAKLWRVTSARLKFQRYHLTASDTPEWIIERYVGRSLVLARVHDAGFPEGNPPAPKWLARRLVREVTDDDAFELERIATAERGV